MAAAGKLSRIVVRAARPGSARGLLAAGSLTVPCALGRAGVTRDKREGDGATPAGVLRFVACWYRPDRVPRPATALPTRAIRAADGWCDDPGDRRYNRPVATPFPAGHEAMWRDDALYDLVVVLDWNLLRPVPGRGSAIFFHLAGPGLPPTAGCVAVGRQAMAKVLARAGPGTFLDVA